MRGHSIGAVVVKAQNLLAAVLEGPPSFRLASPSVSVASRSRTWAGSEEALTIPRKILGSL